MTNKRVVKSPAKTGTLSKKVIQDAVNAVAKTNTNVAKKATPKPSVKKPTIVELQNTIKELESLPRYEKSFSTSDAGGYLTRYPIITEVNTGVEYMSKTDHIALLNAATEGLKNKIKTLEERSLFGEFMFRISKNFR